VNFGALKFGASSSKHDIFVGVAGGGDFSRHNFGSQSAVAPWSSNDLHSDMVADDDDINSAANIFLDLTTVASLFSICHLIDYKNPLPSKISYSPTTMNIPAQSKTAIASTKEHPHEAPMCHDQAL
jgi:hypothetical protein